MQDVIRNIRQFIIKIRINLKYVIYLSNNEKLCALHYGMRSFR